MQLEIPSLDTAQIIVVGPTRCGKSAVMAAIERALLDTFRTQVASLDLVIERGLSQPDKPSPEDVDSIRKTVWVLREVNIPRIRI